jgi:molecular chaperone DnaK
VLRQVATLADVGSVRFCAEPLAAAVQYAARSRTSVGSRLVVYDLGGGTFDVCVVEKTENGFRVLGEPDGVERFGGVDFDESLFQFVMASLDNIMGDLDPDDVAVALGLAQLRRQCVDAKEALSGDVETVVPISIPGLGAVTRRVTRREFEVLIRPSLEDTFTATERVSSAGTQASGVEAIIMVGGSSRIPLVGELLQQRFRVPTATDIHPKHDVVLGAVELHRRRSEPAAGAAERPGPPAKPPSEWVALPSRFPRQRRPTEPPSRRWLHRRPTPPRPHQRRPREKVGRRLP